MNHSKKIHVASHWPAWKKMLSFAGPGYLIAVGYMDPGNWATDLAAGSAFGYQLLFVVLLSNCIAILLQFLSAKLGIATGRDLAGACKDHYSKPVSFFLWVLAEIAIIACDLAEVIGSAIALQLLFGIPLLIGVILTAFDVLLILFLQSRSFRYIELIVISLITFVAVSFWVQIWISSPDFKAILEGFIPTFQIVENPEMLYIAIGILGATVMPHNLYLHSSIVQTRNYDDTFEGKKEAVKYSSIDSTIALMIAFFINAAILIVASAVFHEKGHTKVAEIDQAYKLLSPLVNDPMASTLFALALLASGQNSTLTGILAGQVVMEGFLNIRLAPWIRRFLTRACAIVPAVVCIIWYGEKQMARLLIFSQVILSLQLSFAVIPLVFFTSDKKTMGDFSNSFAVKWLAILFTMLIVGLNLKYVVDFFF